MKNDLVDLIINPSKENIDKELSKVNSSFPEEKFRKDLEYLNYKYDYEDFVNLKVKGHNKEKINLKTYCSYNKEKKIKGIVYNIHGLGSYSNRQTHLAKYLSDSGYFFASMDHREHGYSEKDLNYIYTMDDLISDVIQFIKLTEEYIKNQLKQSKFEEILPLPSFIMGISMGGLLVYYVSKKINFTGVIYIAPCFNAIISTMNYYLVKTASYIYPTKTIPIGNVSLVCKNPNFHEIKDEVRDNTIPTIGTISAIISKCSDFSTEISKKNSSHENSFLMISSGIEKLVCNYTILNYFETSEVKDKEHWFYPTMWHAVYQEDEMKDILPRLVVWLDKRS